MDIAQYGYDIIYAKVIDELLLLEYFSLILTIGDNLGLYELFGFAAGFSANYFCRFCSIHKDNINDMLVEEKCLLRDKENYKRDLEKKT